MSLDFPVEQARTPKRETTRPVFDVDGWRDPLSVPTPYVAVHRRRLEANIARVQAIARSQQISLRPHVKTHKCIEIAQMQLDAGAVGITASKPQEALVFIGAGVSSVTIAYPIVVPETARALVEAAAGMQCDVRFIVDSVSGIEAIASVATRSQHVSVYLKVDVGLGRCGVKPGSAAVESLGRAIVGARGLRFRGLLSHAGHAYGATGPREIAAIANDELRQLKLVIDQLAEARIAVDEVSVGATPSVLAADSFEGVTEIRPGNYVFLDLTACRLGVALLNEVALGVVTTVVSANERYCIIDAGSKVLSSDAGPHGTGGSGFGLGIALAAAPASWREGRPVARLSEEHGMIEHGGEPLAIGARIVVFPNHSCPVANLSEHLVMLRDDGSFDSWPVTARSKTS